MTTELQALKALLEITDATTSEVVGGILDKIHETYPDAVKSFHEPNAQTHQKIPMAGGNPIPLVQAYRKPDHHCYATIFLGPKLGFELSFRIATTEGEPKQDYVNLLANLVNQRLFRGFDRTSGNYVLHHLEDWFGNELKGVLILPDPVFGDTKLSIGTISYRLVLGVTQPEFDALVEGAGPRSLNGVAANELVERRLVQDPFLVTS